MPLDNAAVPKFDDRLAILRHRRDAKMARSAHAFVRGNTVKFYEWLETANGRSVPMGPPVWICGDCHVGNLGPVANVKGRVDIQIRDLDQTVIGNPAHDLIRLALSLATAARGSDLPGIVTARMVEEVVEAYRDALSDEYRARASAHPDAKAVRRVLRQSMRRRWRHLAEERIASVEPSIPRGSKFWHLTPQESGELGILMQSEGVRRLATSLHGRPDDARIEMLDAAYWVKGCSSLGRLRYAVLVAVGGNRKKGSRERTICFLDLKEAVTAAAPRAPGVIMPTDDARRVVAGAKALSPNLGERMLATRFGERPVVVRELLPQDLKLEIDQLTQEEAVTAARYLARVVGEAHARQMDDTDRLKWHAELGKHHSRGLDAPNWLWTSVVDLVASHEAAYLEHCRRLQPPPATAEKFVMA
jgi:uncharacterized protein (DUF2252 family)